MTNKRDDLFEQVEINHPNNNDIDMLIKPLSNWMIVFCCYVFLRFMDSSIHVFFPVNGKPCPLEMSNNTVFCARTTVPSSTISVTTGDYAALSALILP